MIRTTFVEATTVETLESKVNDLQVEGWRYVGVALGTIGSMGVYLAALQRFEADGDDGEGGTADAAIA